MKRNTFRDLEAYKAGKEVILIVYQLMRKFPNEERYAMCDQLRRASVSITSNIAEGSGRISIKEKIHFIEFSYGSLMEVISQIDIACDLNYITKEEFDEFELKANSCANLISGLRRFLEKSLQTNPHPQHSNLKPLTSNLSLQKKQ